MKYSKNDIFNDYRILLPLKANEATGTETYRARSAEGLLCALKIGVSDNEKSTAALSSLFIESGDNHIAYRYVSGESLGNRIARLGIIEKDTAVNFTIELCTALEQLHKKGFSHNGISTDNVLIDMASAKPTPYLTGFGKSKQAENEEQKADVVALGKLMYHMLYGKEPEMPPKLLVTTSTGVDGNTLNILHNALTGAYSNATEFGCALNGKQKVERVNKPTGGGFDDVAGLENLKKQLQEDVIDILANPNDAQEYGLEIPNGMLLYGPPGCGKTFIAEKFAEQAGFNYKYVRSSDLASVYLHGSTEKIRALFDEARHNAPMILCFDEFDALVPRRDDINNASQSGEVNEFLTQLNNCGRDQVFVIATTNRPDLIDSAVLRTGRIDHIIYVPLPDLVARAELLRLATKSKKTDSNVDYIHLAKLTDGYLASDISAAVLQAARQAFRLKQPITTKLIEEAIRSRTPSLSAQELHKYQQLREKFENQSQISSRPHVGFKI